uniref:Uncharacterized protein n=1 Tax=Heterorhabditis bacteriophora TaxID=37862 RepID=A0A1I7WDZ5_HETBA
MCVKFLYDFLIIFYVLSSKVMLISLRTFNKFTTIV